MQWYFLSDTQEQVPVQEDHFAGLVQTGVIRSNTMIWREGMEQWVACSEIKPELFAQRQVMPVVGAAATARQTAALHSQAARATPHPAMATAAATAGMQLGDGQVVREAAAAFAAAAGWMKFLSVLFLILGVGYILSALFVVVAGGSADSGLVPVLILGLITATFGCIIMWMGMLLFQAAAKAQEAAQTAQKHSLLAALSQNARFFKILGISVIGVIVAYGMMFAIFFSVLVSMFGGVAIMDDFDDLGEPPEIELLDTGGDTDESDDTSQ